jgi:hypothetical protein
MFRGEQLERNLVPRAFYTQHQLAQKLPVHRMILIEFFHATQLRFGHRIFLGTLADPQGEEVKMNDHAQATTLSERADELEEHMMHELE